MKALIDIIQVLEILTPDIEETINNWKTLSPLHSFETTLESYSDTVIINDISSSKTLTASLLIPRETPDFE